MAHHAHVRPVHRENLQRRLNPTCRKSMIALCCRCDTVSVVISAGDEPARPDEGLPAPNSPADAARNPAQVSFWLLEPVADAAMTYFYAQLFAMDTEIRAMFPAAMDLQRRRFFEALGRIADAQQSQAADLPSWPAHQRPDAALAAAVAHLLDRECPAARRADP